MNKSGDSQTSAGGLSGIFCSCPTLTGQSLRPASPFSLPCLQMMRLVFLPQLQALCTPMVSWHQPDPFPQPHCGTALLIS